MKVEKSLEKGKCCTMEVLLYEMFRDRMKVFTPVYQAVLGLNEIILHIFLRMVCQPIIMSILLLKKFALEIIFI